MSHLTLLDTQLQSFQYLQKSLKRISQTFNISNNKENADLRQLDFLQGKLAKRIWSDLSIMLNWTPNGYNLVMDKELFATNSNIDVLLENVTQNYATEAIIGESSEIGFDPLSYKQNLDGSKTIILERVCE